MSETRIVKITNVASFEQNGGYSPTVYVINENFSAVLLRDATVTPGEGENADSDIVTISFLVQKDKLK